MALAKKSKFSHNKKRNSGLVYEFLLRKISECVIEKDIKSSRKALGIIKKYYSSGSPLHEEKQLFDTILETRGASKDLASSVLKEITRTARRLNFRIIDIKKSNLIKEINHTFGKTFFSRYDIDDYKVLASSQLYINGCNPKRTLTESICKVKLEESLIRFMISNKIVDTSEDLTAINETSYEKAVLSYNKKYDRVLSESQKNLLSSYTKSLTSNNGKKRLTRYLDEQRDKLLEFLNKSHEIDEIKSDKLIKERLCRAEKLLEEMNFTNSGPKEIENLMMYCKLAEEIASND